MATKALTKTAADNLNNWNDARSFLLTFRLVPSAENLNNWLDNAAPGSPLSITKEDSFTITDAYTQNFSYEILKTDDANNLGDSASQVLSYELTLIDGNVPTDEIATFLGSNLLAVSIGSSILLTDATELQQAFLVNTEDTINFLIDSDQESIQYILAVADTNELSDLAEYLKGHAIEVQDQLILNDDYSVNFIVQLETQTSDALFTTDLVETEVTNIKLDTHGKIWSKVKLFMGFKS